jgi:hypothetical protein
VLSVNASPSFPWKQAVLLNCATLAFMPLGIQKELSDRAENTFQKIPSQRVNQN